MAEPRRPARVYSPEPARVLPRADGVRRPKPAPPRAAPPSAELISPRSPPRGQDFLNELNELCGEHSSRAAAPDETGPARTVRIEPSPSRPAAATPAAKPPANGGQAAGARSLDGTLALALFMAAFGISAMVLTEPPPQPKYIITKVPAPVSDVNIPQPSIASPRALAATPHVRPADTAPQSLPPLGNGAPQRLVQRAVIIESPQFDGDAASAAISEELADALAVLELRPCEPASRARAGAAAARFRVIEFERMAGQVRRMPADEAGHTASLRSEPASIEKLLAAKVQRLTRRGVLPSDAAAGLPAHDCAEAADNAAARQPAGALWQPPASAATAASASQ